MSTGHGIGDRLREAREQVGFTQQQVADWLGVRRPAIAEIESGNRSVKSDELARLAALYGRSIGWLIEGEVGTEEQISAALFRTTGEPDAALQREAAKLARRCALVARLEDNLVHHGHKSRPREYPNVSALTDFSTSVEHGRAVAYEERARLGVGDSAALRDPWGIVEDAGVRVFPMELGSDHPIDGIFTRTSVGHSCVGVNVDKWVFRQVFTVVHEYAHALMDGDISSEACATSQGWRTLIGGRTAAHSTTSRYANRELRANQFAAVFLVPREALLWFLDSRGKLRRGSFPRAKGLSAIELVRAQDHFGASGDMILWRLQNEGFISAAERKQLKDEVNRLGTGVIARSLGYDFRKFAQPLSRAHEIALHGYVHGEISLGALAEIFGTGKEEMRGRLHDWGIHQEYSDDDVLVGGAA